MSEFSPACLGAPSKRRDGRSDHGTSGASLEFPVNAFEASDAAKPPLIYDVGMHNGDDTDYYLTKGWDVVAIDANPDMCRNAELRFAAQVRNGRLRILHLGVGLEEGETPFYLNEAYDPISTFLPGRFGDEPQKLQKWRSVRVPVRRLSSIMRVHGVPNYLKIDVEYHDELVLRDLGQAGVVPAYISVEVKDPETLEQLLRLKYDCFKVVFGQAGGASGTPSWIQTVDGSRVPYVFSKYSSGPLAEDLDGEWLSAEQMVAVVQGSGSSWLDVHAANLAFFGATGP